MNSRSLLVTLGWALIAGAVAVVGAGLFFESSVHKALESAVPAGVLLALAGHLFTQSKASIEAAEKRSAFNLEGFAKAFDHAQSLLSDGNNDRAKWIEAARSLAHGEELAKAVTVDEHKRVLELERLRYRGFFHQVLASQRATFFSGVPPLYPTLDEAAKVASASEERNGRLCRTRTHRRVHSYGVAGSRLAEELRRSNGPSLSARGRWSSHAPVSRIASLC
jgi:hypothetical protein